MDRDTKLIAILRRQFHIILTASWEKIYSELGGVAIFSLLLQNVSCTLMCGKKAFYCYKITVKHFKRLYVEFLTALRVLFKRNTPTVLFSTPRLEVQIMTSIADVSKLIGRVPSP